MCVEVRFKFLEKFVKWVCGELEIEGGEVLYNVIVVVFVSCSSIIIISDLRVVKEVVGDSVYVLECDWVESEMWVVVVVC